MQSTTKETPSTNPDPSPGSRSKMENMSHEDLLKTNRKQLIFLQKLKAKCDDLQTKLSLQSDYDELKIKLSTAEENSSQLQQQLVQVQQRETDLLKSNNAATEELDCLKQKQETLLSSLQCLQTDYDGTVAERKELIGKMKLIVQEKNKTADKNTELDVELQDIKDQLSDKSMQLRALKDHIKDIKDSEEHSKKAFVQLEKENKELKNELSAVKISLDMFKTTSKSKEKEQQQLSEVQNELDKLNTDYQKIKEENKNLLLRILEHDSSDKNYRSEIEAASIEYSGLRKKFDDLEQQLVSQKKKMQQEQEKIESKNDNLRQEFEKDKAKLEENFLKKLEDANASHSAALEENAILKNKNSELSNELMQLQNSVSDFRIRNDELKSSLNDLNAKLSHADSELQKLSSELLTQQQASAQSTSDWNEEKRTLLEEYDQKLETLNEKVIENNNEVLKLKDQINEQNQKNHDWEIQCNELKSENNFCTSKLTELQNDLQAKETQLQTMQASMQCNDDSKTLIDQMQANYDSIVKECNLLKETLVDSKEAETASADEISNLKKNCEILQANIQELQRDKSKLLENLSKEVESCEALKKSNNELNEELGSLNEMLKGYKDNLDKLEISQKNIEAELTLELEKSREELFQIQEKTQGDEMHYKRMLLKANGLLEEEREKLSGCKSEMKLLQHEFEKLTDEKLGEVEKLLASNQQLEDLKNRYSTAQQECSSLTEQIERLTNEREALGVSVQTQLHTSNAELKSELDQLQAAFNLTKENHEKLAASALKLEQENSRLSYHNEEITNLLKDKEDLLGVVSEKLATAENKSKKVVEKLTNDLAQLEDEKCLARKNIESLQAEVVALEERLKSSGDHEQLLHSRQNDHDEIVAEYQMKLEKVMSENEHLQSLLNETTTLSEQKDEDFNSKTRILEQALLDHKNRLTKYSEDIKHFEEVLGESNTTHEQEMKKLKSDHANETERLKLDIKKIEEKFALIEQDIFTKESGNFELKKLVDLKQSVVDQLTESNSELNKQVELLKSECEDLKIKLETVESTSKVEEGSKIEKESLQQSIKEKEAYSAKLKVIAVKAKKELDAAKHQLQTAADEKAQLQNRIADLNAQLLDSQARIMSGAQTLQVECDRLQDEIDQIHSEKSNLLKIIDENKIQINAFDSQKENFSTKLSTALADVDRLKNEKLEAEQASTVSKSLINKLEKEKETLVKEKQAIVQEVEAFKIQVSSFSKQLDEKQRHLNTVETSLEQANKHIQQHDLMSLEMAQYEATLCGLQTQVSDLEVIVREKDQKVNELEQKITDLHQDRRAIEELRLDAEERVTRTKEALDATRDQVARLSEVEHECKGQLDTVTEQFEFVQQQYEEHKLNLASKTSECLKLQENISTMQSLNQRNSELLERKIKQGQDELERVMREKEQLLNDYESYKVRVHSVLKQQKKKEKHDELYDGDAKISSLKSQLSQIHAKLLDTQNILASRDHELDLLQGDYDRLLRQQQQSSEGALERETRWKSRVKTLQQELVALRKQHDDVVLKLSQQRDVMALSISSAVERSREEHAAELEAVQTDLKQKEEELQSLRSEIKKRTEEKVASASITKRVALSPSLRPHAVLEPAVDYRSVARESGEGEEQPDDVSVMSFEQILQTPRIHSVTEMHDDVSVTSEVQVKQLEAKMAAQSKQLEHSTEVARESEATALRLADQNKVLKEEIRRLEKNQERENSVSNMEYLKNVIYKFLTLPPCDEKTHLIPVLDTMLRLSKEERAAIEELATGGEREDTKSSGWGSYLQRWSGMQ